MSINNTRQFADILVTGCPRSGTTFLGKVLSIPPHVGYIREPFNRDFGLEGLSNEFVYLEQGVENENFYRELIDGLLNDSARFKHLPAAEAVRRRQKIGRLLFGGGSKYSYLLSKYNPIVTRLLLKDPMASLASLYLHEQYNVQPIVIVRNPVSTVSSMQRVGVNHDVQDLVRQKELYSRYLKDILSGVQIDRMPVIEQQALLWTCINYVLYAFSKENENFIIIRHEDLSKDPHAVLGELYEHIGLQYSSFARRKVDSLTSPKNPVKAKYGRMHTLRRNSRELASGKHSPLSDQNKKIVLSITKDVEKLFYQ